MKIKYNDFKKYIILLITFLLSIFIILISDSMCTHLCSILFLASVAVIESQFNFSHPYFWYSSFFFLYNCAYMIILIIAPNDAIAKGYNKECSILIGIALGVTLLVMNPNVKKINYNRLSDTYKYNYDIKQLYLLMTFFLFIQLICVFLLQKQGVTSKTLQWKEHNIFWIIATYCTRFNTFITAVLIFMGENLKKHKMLLLSVLGATLYFSLLTGERDAILRLIIVLILCFSMMGIIGFKQLLIIVPIGIIIMIALNYFKYFLTTGVLNRGSFTLSKTLYEFLYSDFVDCGSNLQVIISKGGLEGSKGFGLLIYDLISSIVPVRFMNMMFGNVSNWNVSEWYNNLFYSGSTWNRAFSLVGEGYVMGGIIGVVILFFVIGTIVRIMYKKSSKNPYYAAIYIYCAVSIVGAFRGDSGSIYSYLVRGPLFVVCILGIKKYLFKHSKLKLFEKNNYLIEDKGLL